MVIRPGQAGGHLDPLDVAEHAEGLLASDRATAVEAHLSSCAQCRELAASVSNVTATLSAEPRELTIPDSVATRIDAALAEETAARAASAKPRSEGFLAGLRGRLPVIAAAAASVAVLGLIGYSLTGTGGDDAATTTDAGAGIAESDDAPDSAEAPEEFGPLDEEEAPADDESADLEAEEDTGEETRGDEDDGADGGEEAETFDTDVSARERDALTSELQDILAEQSTQAEPGADGQPCGTVLSEELGGELLGAADTDLVQPGSVLVAIDVGDPDTVSGWVLPDCTAGPDDAAFDFVIPRPPAE
ncbi:MAG TPA: hypothetical protein VFZ37_18610 [Jiangellaceae bacterium]